MSSALTAARTRAEAVEPLDIYLGERVKQARTQRGWSRDYLASQLGLTTQAIEKYETGRNRMFFNRLWAIARALGFEIAWFAEGFDPLTTSTTKVTRASDAELLTHANVDLLERYNLLDEAQQRIIRQTVEQFARAQDAEARLAEVTAEVGEPLQAD
jgi:transcriptional regulator with XRE-family HTH domain